MGLIEDLRHLSEQIKKRQAHVRGEEATKQALVLPFLQLLGFDIYDPTELSPEFTADFAKKRSGGPREKIDYAINLDGTPAIFIECKAINIAVADHDGQLSRYFNSTPSVKLAIITNGLVYRFFTDLVQPNIMDDRPFFEFRIHGFTDKEAKSLARFTKGQFRGALVSRHAQEIIFVQNASAFIQKTLKDPPDSFVRYVLGEIDPNGRVEAAETARYTLMVRESIGLALQEVSASVNHMPQLGASTTTVAAVPAVPAVPAVAAVPAVSRSAVTTLVPSAIQAPVVPRFDAPSAQGSHTSQMSAPSSSQDIIIQRDSAILNEKLNPRASQLELEVLNAIYRICAESSLTVPVKHHIRIVGLSVHLGPARSWFVRMYSRGRRTQLTFQLALALVEPLADGLESGTCPDDFGKSRVYFSTVSDIERLRRLILLAYEDAVRAQTFGRTEDDAQPD